jgi:hypothetical protein
LEKVQAAPLLTSHPNITRSFHLPLTIALEGSPRRLELGKNCSILLAASQVCEAAAAGVASTNDGLTTTDCKEIDHG